jgi:hypothetical protein
VQPVPLYHPLERTAVTLSDQLSLDTITSRISQFLKQQSIPARYDDTGRVDCITDELVKFVVRLWSTTTTTSTPHGGGGGVIVEIQRRQGCCIAMHGLRQQLIEAIRHGVSVTPAPPSRTTCDFLKTLVDQTALPKPNNKYDDSSSCLPSALELCRRLLESERWDEQRLGLESLCILTDPHKVVDADEASLVILTDSHYSDLLEPYFVHAQMHRKNTDTHASTSITTTTNMDYEQGDYFGALHLLALKALSQALESVARRQVQIPLDLDGLFWRTTLESLYDNLSVASSRPLEAAWSIRCLRDLQTLEPKILHMAPRRLYESLVHAHDYGRQHHRSLERETEQWMGRLGFVH